MGELLALCYHGISDSWPAPIAIAPRTLRRQLEGVLRRGYVGCTMSAGVSAPPGPRVLAVTFDDACRSVLAHAAPILEELGVPGTVFAPTDFIGSRRPMTWPGIDQWLGGPHEGELVPMDWDELGRLAAAGWEIGSHTCSHPHLTRCSDAALVHELGASRERIANELGVVCTAVAYPYGNVDDRVAAAARDCGYSVGAAISSRRPERALDWPRVGVFRRDTPARFRLKTSRTARRLRTRGPTVAPAGGA